MKKLKNNKGFVLVLAALAVMVVLGLSAAFFLRSVGEKRIVDVEKFIMQADFLAEAGASHGICELRDRIGVDFSANVNDVSNNAVFSAYFVNGDSLGLLRDYAYAQGEQQFTVSEPKATLTLIPLNVITNINGSYDVTVTITEASEPTNPEEEEYNFYYNYLIQGTGTSAAITPNISKKVNLTGSFSVMVKRDNLARYAVFTNIHRSSSGTPIWFNENTNFFGPVRTNEWCRFAHNPSSHFTHEVSQHNDTAAFYNNRLNGNEGLFLDNDHNQDIDVPTFDVGFERGVGVVDLQSAVDSGNAKSQALGGGQEPEENGVYLPNEEGQLTGGIYIRGTVTELELKTDDDDNPRYVIHQGPGEENRTRITVNYEDSTTRVKQGNSPVVVYQGIPDGLGDEGTLIYSKNAIQQLSGTVQEDSVVTLSSEEDIIITGHVRYEDYNVGPPVNATGATNMLGIVSFGGNVRIGTAAPNNIDIHAVVMAPNGQFQVDNYWWGSSRGTATLLGGAITNYYGAFGTFGGSGYRRNFVHDARTLAGQIPPYFLSMTSFVSDDSGLEDRPLWQKVE